MKLFIGWSGETSHKVAMALRDWIPSVIQSIEPYVSSEDIAKGVRWSADIAKQLETSNVGVICVTKENVGSEWINFEAGALSKEIESANVIPFLFDLTPAEIRGPLAQFQCVVNDRDDIYKLLTTLNTKGGVGPGGGGRVLEASVLDKAFKVWWQQLEAELSRIAKAESSKAAQPRRDTSVTLDELLDLSRSQARELAAFRSSTSVDIDILGKGLAERTAQLGRS